MRRERTAATVFALCIALAMFPLEGSALPLSNSHDGDLTSVGTAAKRVSRNQGERRFAQTGQWGSFILRPSSSWCIDPSGDFPGAPLQLGVCGFDDPFTDQQWEITSDGFIRSVLSGMCMDVQGTPGDFNGATLQLWDCEWGDPFTDQRWDFTSDGFIRNFLSGRCIDSLGDFAGATLQLWDCDPFRDQRWVVS